MKVMSWILFVFGAVLVLSVSQVHGDDDEEIVSCFACSVYGSWDECDEPKEVKCDDAKSAKIVGCYKLKYTTTLDNKNVTKLFKGCAIKDQCDTTCSELQKKGARDCEMHCCNEDDMCNGVTVPISKLGVVTLMGLSAILMTILL